MIQALLLGGCSGIAEGDATSLEADHAAQVDVHAVGVEHGARGIVQIGEYEIGTAKPMPSEQIQVEV